MGCGGSKIENSPLVVLCKERKELIKAASDSRYDLATAHVLYFDSLSNVSDALHRFVEEELTIVVDPPQSHMVFPSSDSVSEPNSGSLTDYVHRDSEVDEGAEPTDHRTKDRPKVDLNVRYIRNISKVKTHEVCEQQQVARFERLPSTQLTGLVHDNDYFNESIPLNYQQNDFTYPRYEDRDSRLHRYGIERSFGGLTSNNSYYNHVHPPAPSPPEISDWDYLNPFSMIDDVCFHQDDRVTYETRSGGDNLDSGEMREREGVPELEDEIDKQSVCKVFVESSETSTDKCNAVTSDKDAKQSSEAFISDKSGDATKEGLGAKIDQAFPLECESWESRPTHGSRDVHDVVNQIKHAFENTYDYGKEVSILLEEGKLPYRHMGSKLKELASWILSLLSVSFVTSSQPRQHMLIDKAPEGGGEDDICKKFGALSSTLEKLCAWERKLHEEVKGEENLRIAYDKECKKLNDLDDRGTESYKMDKVWTSINQLLSKINVAVAAVHIISTRIFKLRDEELYPQLSELIEGLIRMWNSMAECHHKQFQDIFNSQSYLRKARIGIKEKSSSKATLNFEMEISRWCARFIDYVEVQKAFTKGLNQWLTRCLSQDPEESPSRIGAPHVFVLCNDWCRATEKISGEGVSKAVLDLASSLHELQMKQYEEHNQRVKVDYLSEYLEKRLKYLSDRDASLKNATDDLVLVRKRLSEQKTKHEEAVKKANEAASCCIQVRLVRVLEAMEKFSLDSLKAYDQVRIVKRGEEDT